MRVIAYAYDADHHCESCMLAYARSVPYSEYQFSNEFGTYSDDDIQYYDRANGIINVANAVEFGIIRDSEGNPIHPVFETDEWYNIGYGNQTLSCGDCGDVLDEYEEEEDGTEDEDDS